MLSAGAFGDIGRDGHNCPAKLRCQSVKLLFRELLGHFVNLNGKIIRQLKRFNTLVISHHCLLYQPPVYGLLSMVYVAIGKTSLVREPSLYSDVNSTFPWWFSSMIFLITYNPRPVPFLLESFVVKNGVKSLLISCGLTPMPLSLRRISRFWPLE